MTDPVLARPLGAPVRSSAELGDHTDLELVPELCAHCRLKRSSLSAGAAVAALIAVPVGDRVGSLSVRADAAIAARLEETAAVAVTAAPVACLVCRLDFEAFADPTEAAYFSRLHNEMHHGALRWHYPFR